MKLIILLCYISFCFAKCSPPLRVTGSWKTAEQLEPSNRAVFILSISGDEKIRKMVEDRLATEASKQGYAAFKSGDHMFMGTRNLDSVLDKAIELKCDLIFSAALLDRKKERYHVKSSIASYGPNAGLGFSSGFGSTVYTPGYYKEDEVYFFESNLYDTRSKKVIWSAQSESAVLSDLKSFSKKYAKTMVKQLEADKILKK
jgi:hypothetical protein